MTFTDFSAYFKALRTVNPAIVTFDGTEGAFDQDGNSVTVDETALQAAYDLAVVELQWESLRRKRDELIAETDWWATSDRTMTAEQTAYRQALRDLPANTTDPENPVWPTKP